MAIAVPIHGPPLAPSEVVEHLRVPEPVRASGPTAAPPRRERSALVLQRLAGNRAVAGAVAGAVALAPTIQRSPDKPAWGKPGTGLNQQERLVAGGTMRRIPVDGLPGNQQQFAPKYGEVEVRGKKLPDGGENEAKRTGESAAGRAIVIVPTGLVAKDPVDVMVHLHGWTSRPWDPFPGWRETFDHKVRDEALDRIEDQMTAAGNHQIIGILPQGVGHSDFGGLSPETYVGDVMKRLQQIGTFERPPTDLHLIVSAHSGGGSTVAKALDRDVRPGEDAPHNTWTKDQQKQHDKDGSIPEVAADAPPPVMAPTEVVLFEAINTPGQLQAVEDWISRQLDRVVAAKDKVAAVKQCGVLRAYRSTGGYIAAYDALHHFIKRALAERAGQLGPDEAAVAGHFQVRILVGTAEHEQSVRGVGAEAAGGPMADALRAHTGPNDPSQLVNDAEAEKKYVDRVEAAFDQRDEDEAKRKARKAKK